MFWSYQSANLAHFGVMALLVGLLVVWLISRGKKLLIVDGQLSIVNEKRAAARPSLTINNQQSTINNSEVEGEGRVAMGAHLQSPISQSLNRTIPFALILLTALDLFLAHGSFNPATDPALSPLTEQGTPPVVRFINEREGNLAPPWRFTTFNAPGAKTFNANVGMYYGWQDIRGYDSIIPRQYVDLMNRLQPQANELLYNRIAPVYSQPGGDVYAALDSPLLDLLNVKYLLTEHYAPNPGWQEIYRDDAIGVYENQEVLPRAFIARRAEVLPAEQQPLTGADLRNVVFLEETPAESGALVPASPQIADARVSR